MSGDLDEVARRRPDFAGGVPVRMADGREWTLAKPLVTFGYSSGEMGFDVFLEAPGADGYAEAIRELEEAGEAGDMARVVRAHLALGAALLRRNYTLSDHEVGALLRFAYDPGHAEAYARKDAVVAVARGEAPKPPAATSG